MTPASWRPVGAHLFCSSIRSTARLPLLKPPCLFACLLAVELRSVSDGGFVIKMRDGRNLRCVQNNPRVLRLRDSAPHHAIVLKMEDGSDLLLPIIVSTYQFPACCLDECLIDVINRCCRCFFFLLLVLNLVACSCYFNHIPPQWRRQASCFWLRFGTSEL